MQNNHLCDLRIVKHDGKPIYIYMKLTTKFIQSLQLTSYSLSSKLKNVKVVKQPVKYCN